MRREVDSTDRAYTWIFIILGTLWEAVFIAECFWFHGGAQIFSIVKSVLWPIGIAFSIWKIRHDE